jgi:hypothetical protein
LYASTNDSASWLASGDIELERSRSLAISRALHMLAELRGTGYFADERLLPTRLGSVDPCR